MNRLARSPELFPFGLHAQWWSYHLANELDEGVTNFLKCFSVGVGSDKAQYQDTP